MPQADTALPHDAKTPALVVVAEDHLQMRELLVSQLRDAGHEVLAAEDGIQLRELLECSLRTDRVPALIVTDVQMPGCGGFEIIRAFRGRIDSSRFLVVTALRHHKALDEASALGVAGVLIKPFPVHHLIELVSQLVVSPRVVPL